MNDERSDCRAYGGFIVCSMREIWMATGLVAYFRCLAATVWLWLLRETALVLVWTAFLVVWAGLGLGASAPNVTGAFSCSAALGVANAGSPMLWIIIAVSQQTERLRGRFMRRSLERQVVL